MMSENTNNSHQNENEQSSIEQRFGLLFDSMPIAIGIVRYDGTILYANPALAEVFRSSIEDMISQKSLQFYVQPDNREKILKRIEENGKITGYEVQFKRSDETVFWGMVNANKITLNGENAIQFTITDITSQKETTKAKMARYIESVDDSPLPFIITRMDRKFRYANHAAVELFGYSEMDDFKKYPLSSRYTPESVDMIEDWWDNTKTGHPEYMAGIDYQIIRKDGEVRQIKIYNKPVLWAGEEAQELIYIDVTEQNRVQSLLKKTEERLRLHFNNSPIGIVEWNDDFSVMQWTGEAPNIFGWSSEEVLGRRLTDLNIVYEEDIPLIEKVMNRMINENEPYIIAENRNYTKDGRVLHCTWYNSVIKDENNRLESILSFVVDVTEQYKTDIERIALNGASRSVLTSKDFNDAAREIFDYCRHVTGASSGYIALLNEATQENDVLFLEAGGMPCSVDPSLPMPVRGFRELAYRTKQTVYDNNFPATEWEGLLPEGHVRLQNVLFSPLIIEDKAVGVIGLANKPDDFDEADVAIMNSLSEICSIALVNSRNLEMIEQSEKKYRMLFESVSEGFTLHRMIYDENGEPEDYIYLEVNPAFLSMSGFKEEEIVGKKISEILPAGEGDQSSFIRDYGNIVKTGESYQHEQYSFNLNKWFSVSAFRTEPDQFAILSRDITNLKESQKILEEEATRRRILIEESRDGIVILHEDGSVFESNKRFAEMIGYTPEEMNSLTVFDWEYQYPKDRLKDSLYVVDDAGSIFESKHKRKDGSVYDVEISANAATIKDEKLIFCVCRDISERKAMEASLREAEDRFKKSINDSPICIHIYDRSGALVFVNKAGLDLRGYTSVEEFRNASAKQRMTPESYEKRIRWIKDREEGKRLPAHYFFDIVKPNGEIRNLECFRSNVFFEGSQHEQIIAVDITERIEANRHLQDSEDRFHQLFDNMSSGVAIYEAINEGEDFIFLDFNKAGQQIENLSRQDLIGKKVTEVFPGVNDFGLLDVFKRVWKTGVSESHPVSQYEDNRITGWRENFIYRLPSGELVAIYNDYTEQKQAEEREKQLQEELITQSRLAMVGEMAAGMAHEINNPLTGVVGFSSLLMKKDLPEDVLNEINIIYEGAQRVASITNRLLTFARQQEPKLTKASINEILENTLSMQSYEMSTNNIEVITSLDPDLPETYLDVTQIQQVFLNIIINAETELKKVRKNAVLAISSETIDGNIKVSFKDNGPGIRTEDIDKIFNPFFTTREVGEGTGLGLSVSYGIIKRHNGDIYVESVQGQGATFIVELPITQEEENNNLMIPPRQTEGISDIDILIIDDEVIVQNYINQLLTGMGNRVTISNSGEDAIEKLKNAAYNVILLDIKLPGLSGFDVYEYINSELPDSADKVIFVTGDVMSEDTLGYIRKYDIPAINKPFGSDELIQAIKSIIENQT